jgi:hypothetical protein
VILCLAIVGGIITKQHPTPENEGMSQNEIFSKKFAFLRIAHSFFSPNWLSIWNKKILSMCIPDFLKNAIVVNIILYLSLLPKKMTEKIQSPHDRK